LTTLLENLFHTYDAADRGVRKVVRVSRTELPIDLAIPCGLIVNELVINALKHAFPNKRRGTVSILLEESGEGTLRLAVADDGVGIPATVDPERTRSLGLTLVFTFAEQLDATVQIDRTGGTTFRIEFSSGGD